MKSFSQSQLPRGSGRVLNFVSNPVLRLAEMRRTAIADGTIAAYVWDYAGKMELMRLLGCCRRFKR
jgi:hypothetical protein